MNILDLLKTDPDQTMPEKYKHLSVEEMTQQVLKIKQDMGEKLFIPAHHYQKDEVVQFADTTGDSLQLAQTCADNSQAEFIVFCGVHFMAETADMLTQKNQTVLLPDLRAGCSLADMADIKQTETCWNVLQETFGDTVIPLTYVNSTAAIKAFVGKNGGATVTSSNAEKMITWALNQKERILFLPDQHLGRNVSYDLGIPLDKMAVWNPILDKFEYDGDIQDAKIILWKGHCSVHENFTVQNINDIRKKTPEVNVLVHPECPYETVAAADFSGSTSYIINMIEQAPSHTKWAIGTEMNLVQRLINDHPDKEIVSLNPNLCPCMTMNRIDLPHLLWSLDSIKTGNYKNIIKVDEITTHQSINALNKMLEHI